MREKKSGRFQHRYVDWQSKTVLKRLCGKVNFWKFSARYKLSVQGLAEDSNVILALTVENAKMRPFGAACGVFFRREWMVKDDGSHWKNTLPLAGRHEMLVASCSISVCNWHAKSGWRAKFLLRRAVFELSIP